MTRRDFTEAQAPPHTRRILHREQLLPNPLEQFLCWHDDAQGRGCPLPHAMTLATASQDGAPSARMVLLKAVDDRGFVFYTNSGSRKGREMAENPQAALVFHWPIEERQVRVTGTVSRATDAEADAYFATRSRGSRLAAWASLQSRPIERREQLAEQVQEMADRHRGVDVPRPPHWGGYVVSPETIEFWQGGFDRLHDRFLYIRQEDGTWTIERLSP